MEAFGNKNKSGTAQNLSETKQNLFSSVSSQSLSSHKSTDMYNLTEWWHVTHGELPTPDWDGKLYCAETDAAMTFRTNETHGFLSCYSFTLVVEGWLTLVYNGHELTFFPNDLYVYSPGMAVTIVSASHNYRSICLIADEQVTIGTPVVRDLVRVAYMPIVQLHEPKISLTADVAQRLMNRMREISDYLHMEHSGKADVLRMLYAVFLLDLRDGQNRAIVHRQVPQRVEELFIGFVRLLSQHFAAHHDIPFYAASLNITPTYLSRIVRQVAGRTVVDYVNSMLVVEASFLLRTSSLSISQIADRLHFADVPSFSKFFARHKGMSPREFREG